VKTLILNPSSPVTAVEWNAKDYPAGIYFLKVRTNGYEQTEKLILIK